MTRLPPNAFRLYTSSTPSGHDLYPGQIGQRVARTQSGVLERRVVTGPVSADAESLISSWTQDDYSGGFGIKDGNETTDTSRIEFGVIDGRRPKSMALPPLTEEVTSPTWSESGGFYPLGDIGTQFYGAWTNGISGWNTATDAWHTTQNSWPASFTMANRPVEFCGYLYVPGGSTGICRLSENTAATGTLTVSARLTTITAVAMGLHDDKLWAIDTNNKLFMLTPLGAAAGGVTLANWGILTGTATTSGGEITDGFGNDVVLPTGLTPTHLFSWFNPGGDIVLHCVTRGQGVYMFNPDEGRWIKRPGKAGAHPDWGLAADIFRDGEDMFISAGGLDVSRYTTSSVEVPLSGPSKDQGVPPTYQGNIVDLNSERSSLYALIQSGTAVAAGSPTSTWVLQQTIGNFGSGSSEFKYPWQVALDSSANVYIADYGNSRIKKLTSAGVFSTNIVPSISGVRGVAVDSSGNIYASFENGHSDHRLSKYNSAGTLQWTSATLATDRLSHVATDGTHVWVAAPTSDVVYKRLCSDGSAVATVGSSGSGNGQFDGPTGLALDSTHLYVADTGNSRVQKMLKSDGSYVAKWGSAGTGDGAFDTPQGVGVDASGDIWICDYGNNRLQRTSNTGTYQTQIAQTTPRGIGVTSGDILWVSTGTHTLVEWDEESVTSDAVPARSWLGAWTGTAWCALWESGDTAITPTWLRVALKGDYALWWGNSDGVAYRQLLPPPFFNPAARVELGVYPFAATGWMQSIRYDANMSGWDKIASHFFAQMDYASASEYVDVSYRTDADQWESGLLEPDWRPWKRIDHIGRTLCWFDDTDTDPISGLPWHEGEPFQWIQFRYDFARGATTTKSPIWMWHSLHHLAVPQDSAVIPLTVVLPQKPAMPFHRSMNEMAETLFGLQTYRGMVHLQTHSPDPDHPEWQVYFRGKVTQVKSEGYIGADNNLAEVVTLSFVEIGAASLTNTTVAVDTP
jgi:hypothetical protein